MAIIRNRATLTYNGSTVTSNEATGEIAEPLTATKSAFPETYETGDNVTYAVNLVNSGEADLTGISVTDDLGAYSVGGATVYPLSYVDGSAKVFVGGEIPQDPVSVDTTNGLVISGFTVPAGGSAAVVYTAQVTGYAPLGTGGAVTNTATADGAGIQPVEASATITNSPEPRLTIAKSIDPPTVRASGTVTYTLTVRNYGGTEAGAADSVVISDTLDPILSNLTASLGGTPMTPAADYTYDVTTGVFETVAGAVTVPAATFTQSGSGEWIVIPGETVLTISGNVT